MEAISLPRSCRQPRSRRPSRPSRQGSLIGFYSRKDDSSTTTTASIDQSSDTIAEQREDISEVTLLRCSMSWNQRRNGMILESMEGPVTQIGSVSEDPLDSCTNGYHGLHLNDRVNTHSTAGPLSFDPDKSVVPTDGISDAWLAPGNVVWARTAYNEWWPAEVVDEKATSECISNQHAGQILVQLYGSLKFAWLDPLEDLSQFDYCYEERSKNPLEAFQDALKQALERKLHLSPCMLPNSSDEVKTSIKSEQTSEKQGVSSSSDTKDHHLEEGRGKRKRKLKVHFDELSIPKKAMKKVRRLRIMRYLGLVAPAGSPFTLTHGRTD